MGAIFDGTGYGTDGTIWGGELLYGGLDGFERVGHALAVRLPGGAQAIRQPWRMACAWLMAAGDGGADGAEPPPIPRRMRGDVADVAWRQVARAGPKRRRLARDDQHGPAVRRGVGAVRAARQRVNYEGQAAVELEAVCDPASGAATRSALEPDGATLVIDPRETIRAVADEMRGGRRSGRRRQPLPHDDGRRHGGGLLPRGALPRHRRVVLSGGVFQNRRLMEDVAAGLRSAGLHVLVPERLP